VKTTNVLIVLVQLCVADNNTVIKILNYCLTIFTILYEINMGSTSTRVGGMEITPSTPAEGMLETQSLSITGDGTTHITTHQLPIESQKLTQKEVDAKPWKFIGYPGYSSFLASETDLLIFRRFGATSARIALKLQDNVVVLEEELSKLDGNFARREAKDVQNGSFRIEQPDREKVMNQLHNALLEYSKCPCVSCCLYVL
jgi:hypothetical protein